MPEQHRDRQYSILEYTIQATTQFSQTGFGFDDSFSNILETTRISPNGDHNDHDNGGSSFEDGIDFHGISFSSSALFPESSTVEHCSPSSPASSEEQEQDRSSSTVDKSSPHHQQSLPLTAETCKKAESLKREHTIVERNYRSRLNSKIEALSQQLFDVPSNKRKCPKNCQRSMPNATLRRRQTIKVPSDISRSRAT